MICHSHQKTEACRERSSYSHRRNQIGVAANSGWRHVKHALQPRRKLQFIGACRLIQNKSSVQVDGPTNLVDAIEISKLNALIVQVIGVVVDENIRMG